MDFLLLGPFAARLEGQEIALGRRRERCLLAILLLEANRIVSTDRLVSLLWEEQVAPATARRAVHAHVARLRAVLRRYPTAPQLVSKRVGYLAEVAANSVDVHRFRAMVERADRCGDAVGRAALFRDALGLWRGPLLADLASPSLCDRIGRSLVEQRGHALEGWLGAELDCGRHREALPALAEATGQNPEHERLAALYLLALHRSGRTAEAGEFYARFRQQLVELTGIEPSHELRDLHAAILRGEAPGFSLPPSVALSPPTTPVRSLPAPIAGFVGRAAELEALDSLREWPRPAPALAVVHGVGGVGKTALALHWAHTRAVAFPDGTVYLDLGEREPVSGEELLRLVLRQHGLSDDRIPDDPEDRAALYRSAVATGRRLVILDNVATPAQVRAALPLDPNVTLVALSRDALPGLTVHQRARHLRLDPLLKEDAVQLLAMLIGADKSENVLGVLARLCDRMPLALRIVGCRLADDPGLDAEAMVAELSPEDRRLSALEIDEEDGGIRAAFDASYRRLDPGAARVFRVLGRLPVCAASVANVAAACGLSRSEARRFLEVLSRRQLAFPDAAGYRMHDLVRLYARERSAAQETQAAADEALQRLASFCLDTTFHAYPLLSPRRAGQGDPPLDFPPAEPQRFGDREEALAWFEAERDNLAAVIRELGQRSRHRLAATLAGTLFVFFHQRRLWRDWVDTYTVAWESARLEGDRFARTRVLSGLGVAYKQLGRFEQAAQAYHGALAAARESGDVLSIGSVLVNLGGLCTTFGREEEARRHLEMALALPGYADDPRYAPVLWLNLTHMHFSAGELDRAADSLSHGQAAADASGDAHTMAYLHHWAGELALRHRRFESAAASAAAELEIARALRDPLRQAYALDLLASATAERAPATAREHWDEAQALCDQLGHPLGADIAALLPANRFDENDLIARRIRVNCMP